MQPACHDASKWERFVLDTDRPSHQGAIDMPSHPVIGTLNDLIHDCRDIEGLCRACSEAVRTCELGAPLRERAEEWGRQADELQALVLLLGGTPAIGGSWRAPLTRLWLAAKTSALGPDDLVALDTCLHSSFRALERFEDALEGYLPERIRRTVGLHAARIGERIDAIDALRGSYARAV
jgi:uncharacterized protein (TIGR02284 family)